MESHKSKVQSNSVCMHVFTDHEVSIVSEGFDCL
jgi:hypothetical protein